MAVSDNTGHRLQADTWKRLLGQLSRYDLLLAAIPLIFTCALTIHLLVAVSLHVVMGAGATLSGLLVADALYFNPPTAAEPTRTEGPESR